MRRVEDCDKGSDDSVPSVEILAEDIERGKQTASPSFDKAAGASADNMSSQVTKTSTSNPARAGSSKKTPKKLTANSLLAQMHEAHASNSEERISKMITEVENANVDWGDLMPKKRQVMKKLRAKKKKLEQVDDGGAVPSEPVQAPDTSHPVEERTIENQEGGASRDTPAVPIAASVPTAASDVSSDSKSDKNWVMVKNQETYQMPTSHQQLPSAGTMSLDDWCQNINLPSGFAEQLRAEDVTNPRDLVCLPDDDLVQLTSGLKLGAKGRFLAAVREMR